MEHFSSNPKATRSPGSGWLEEASRKEALTDADVDAVDVHVQAL